MNSPETEQRTPAFLDSFSWNASPYRSYYLDVQQPRPSRRSFALATVLFALTFITALVAGAHFAAAYAHDQAVSLEVLLKTFRLLYRNPAALLSGLPFAVTLLGILLAHELGHFYACRYHHIRVTYPFFIPAPTLIGTFGAFILIRSPIRSARALFDVGASGPVAGFLVALPALVYGVLHARVIPSLGTDGNADLIFGVPMLLRAVAAVVQPNADVTDLLLHPVGRAAWVGLFATALNLLPVGQLDGGHIVRSVSPRAHKWISLLIPLVLLGLGFFRWQGWLLWAAILFGLRFFRAAPIYDPTPLDPQRRFGVAVCLIIFLLCFMPDPL
ncbi:MAG TPA: site-2 protease family protein [Candidatus Acidoferrum sp.]